VPARAAVSAGGPESSSEERRQRSSRRAAPMRVPTPVAPPKAAGAARHCGWPVLTMSASQGSPTPLEVAAGLVAHEADDSPDNQGHEEAAESDDGKRERSIWEEIGTCICLSRQGKKFVHPLRRDQPAHQPQPSERDEEVVQVPDHGDPVRNELDRAGEVGNNENRDKPREKGSARVPRGEVEGANLYKKLFRLAFPRPPISERLKRVARCHLGSGAYLAGSAAPSEPN